VSEAKSVSRAAALRASFPEGTIPVAAALLIAGVATYLFFAIGKTAVGGADEFTPLSSLWFATFALAPGFFLPLEQELGRGLGHRRAVGDGGRPVVAKVARLGLLLASIVALAILCVSPWITSAYFDGDWVMLVALVVAFCAYAPAHISRGICSGSGRFHSYAVVIGSDGVVRVTICTLFALIGISAVGPYAFLIALSPLVGIAFVASKGQLATSDGSEATWKEVTPNLGWLLLGSVFAAALLNAGPVLVNIMSEDTPEAEEMVTEFGYGVLLARIPLFMFQAVQAALLPRLSRLAASGNFVEFRNGLRRLLVLVVGVGVVGSLGALAIGPFMLETVYNAELDGATLATLAAGSGCYMVALALAQAVIALRGHSLVGLGWVVGAVALALGVWLSSDDVFRRVEIGVLASSIAAMTFFAFALRYKLAMGVRPDDESVLEALADRPLES
jgi:O-antigen/teichoic acid export membrane protein